MMKQKGFTLIELVVVIVILGILSVTAAPRFLNLQQDARISSLQGLRGAMAGAGNLVYAKAAIAGIEGQSGQAITGGNSGNNINVDFGYPDGTVNGIVNAVDGLNSGTDWMYKTSGSSLVVTFNDGTGNATNNGSVSTAITKCFVQYTPATSASEPTITVNEDC